MKRGHMAPLHSIPILYIPIVEEWFGTALAAYDKQLSITIS